jgi:hypothetical protein
VYKPETTDEAILIFNQDAIRTSQRLAEEGIPAGIATGADIRDELNAARKAGRGKVVLATVLDLGKRYSSTDVSKEVWDEKGCLDLDPGYHSPGHGARRVECSTGSRRKMRRSPFSPLERMVRKCHLRA